MVNFKLNGKDVTVPKGSTVMEAAKRENVAIPHFCYHEGLSVAGVCRFCMVRVEGRPKMEIACNLQAVEGMVVDTESEEVKNVHKWGLELHLVNHPLDCPVCDQAGECELQDNYMNVGKYKSKMTRGKVLKPKKLDVGSQLVLDTERCILCSRCVRFEDEVTKTSALGIFDRGDRAIIGTYGEEKIDHQYQENLVDICPVGAFTSKEFRFKQRVWFLKEKASVCNGCSTGCHINVHGKPDRREYFRVKPRHSDANGHWMCDEGRHTYKYLNSEERLSCAWFTDGVGDRRRGSKEEGIEALALKLKSTPAEDVAILISAQQTNEEYRDILEYFVTELGIKNVFQWRQREEVLDAFDGILLRGDRNPNTAGLMAALKGVGIPSDVENQFDACLDARPKLVIAIAPESPMMFPGLKDDLDRLGDIEFASVWSTNYLPETVTAIENILPVKGFAEKVGSFTNYKGEVGELADPFPSIVPDAMDASEIVKILKV